MLDTLRQITEELSRATSLEDALAIVVHRVKEYLAVDENPASWAPGGCVVGVVGPVVSVVGTVVGLTAWTGMAAMPTMGLASGPTPP